MGVQYCDFKDVSIDEVDAIIVGSGFAGGVVARELAERGNKRVLVIEKRPHIGGNMYDEADEAGILVHRYGPHIFHTNDRRAFEYVRRFTEWRDYEHEVLADWYGTYLPVPFNKNSMEIAFGDEKAARLTEKLIDTFGDERKVTITELREQDDPELSEIADFIYNAKAVGSYARRGGSFGDGSCARVCFARQSLFSRCLPRYAPAWLYASI